MAKVLGVRLGVEKMLKFPFFNRCLFYLRFHLLRRVHSLHRISKKNRQPKKNKTEIFGKIFEMENRLEA